MGWATNPLPELYQRELKLTVKYRASTTIEDEIPFSITLIDHCISVNLDAISITAPGQISYVIQDPTLTATFSVVPLHVPISNNCPVLEYFIEERTPTTNFYSDLFTPDLDGGSYRALALGEYPSLEIYNSQLDYAENSPFELVLKVRYWSIDAANNLY